MNNRTSVTAFEATWVDGVPTEEAAAAAALAALLAAAAAAAAAPPPPAGTGPYRDACAC